MCPACLSAVALITVGATSAGGIAVYTTIKIASRTKAYRGSLNTTKPEVLLSSSQLPQTHAVVATNDPGRITRV